MTTDWIDPYVLTHTGAVSEYKPEWESQRFLLKDKMFGMMGHHKDGRPILSLKLEPAHSDLLRKEYADIIPGYYLNKDHWSSIYLDTTGVPRALVQQLIDEAYTLILRALPKKTQAEILSATP